MSYVRGSVGYYISTPRVRITYERLRDPHLFDDAPYE